MYEGEETNFEAPPAEETSNRTFLIVAGILGGIVLLSLVCLAVFGLFILPGQQATRLAAEATATAQAVQVEQALTATALSISLTQAPLATPTFTETPPPSPTPVLAQPTGTPPSVTPNPATATVAAALTQAALAQLTIIPTSTALPGTGFADEYGAPGLVVMALVFGVIIFLARRLRSAPIR